MEIDCRRILFKQSLHSEVRNSLLFRCKAYVRGEKTARKPSRLNDLERNSQKSLLRSLGQEEFLPNLGRTWNFQSSQTINSLRNSLRQGI